MTASLLLLIPIAIGMGLAGLITFIWAVHSGQFDDLDGAANRILIDEEDVPLSDQPSAGSAPTISSDPDVKSR